MHTETYIADDNATLISKNFRDLKKYLDMVSHPLLPKVAGMNESSCGVWKPRLYSRKRIRRGGFTKSSLMAAN